VSGAAPLYNEAGKYVGPSGNIGFWWNLDPSSWSPISTASPSPAGQGPVVELAVTTISGHCTYRVEFTVPRVPVGTYAIVPYEFSRNSSSPFQTLRFRVVAGSP